MCFGVALADANNDASQQRAYDSPCSCRDIDEGGSAVLSPPKSLEVVNKRHSNHDLDDSQPQIASVYI